LEGGVKWVLRDGVNLRRIAIRASNRLLNEIFSGAPGPAQSSDPGDPIDVERGPEALDADSMALFQHTPPRDRARDTARGYAAIRLSIFPIEVPADAGKEVQSAVLLVHGAPALTLSG
jgi:hypothetical protein